MKHVLVITFLISIMGLSSCYFGPESPRGFSLPEGDVEKGKLVFVKYQCLSCHKMSGMEPATDLVDNPDISVRIGGKTTSVKTYADLLTSVINPSHKLARGYKRSLVEEGGVSKMKVYNEVMTVSELVDLVTFLESSYELEAYNPTSYNLYRY